MPIRTTPRSNLAKIRQKFRIAFDDSTLSAFCLDYFAEVYENFSQGMRKDYKITLLLDHCRRRPNGFKSLLDSVREEYQMSNFQRKELVALIHILEAYTNPSSARSEVKIHNFTVQVLVVNNLYILQSESDLVGQTAPVILNPDTISELAYTPAKYERSDSEQMSNLGKDIYYKLLSEEVRTHFEQARAIARKEKARLRLLLKLGQSQLLHQIPWELMHDSHRAIAFDPLTTIVRLLEQQTPVKSIRVKPPLRVLFTSACPQGVEQLNLQREANLLRSVLNPFGASIELEVRPNISLPLLRQAIIRAQVRNRPFHIWHHCGHGVIDSRTTDIALVLEEEGKIEQAWTKEILSILNECPSLSLTILNLFYRGHGSRLAPSLARFNIPAIIGFRYISDDVVALNFMRALYRNLLRQTVDVALKSATRTLFDPIQSADWALPLCFLRTTNASLLR